MIVRLAILCGCLWSSLPLVLRADDEIVHSIVNLVGEEKSWKTFGEAKTRFVIEGRFDERSQDRVLFTNCKLPFLAAPGVKLSLISRNLQNCRVSGYFDIVDDQPIFRVERLQAAADDAELARLRQLKLDREQPDDWFALGDWYAERGTFYSDKSLLSHADTARIKGFELLRRRVGNPTSKQLLEWVRQMRAKGISAERTLPWVHAAMHEEKSRLPERPSAGELHDLAERIADQLPGARTALELPLPKLVSEYQTNPNGTYDDADVETRKKLDRILYRDLIRREIETALERDGSNSNEIAARFERELPDLPELAATYRLQHLQYRKTNVDRATREQAIELAREFRNRQQEDEAAEVISAWLDSRLRGWKNDGVDGLVHAASEYLNLKEDRDTAAALLREAWNKSPDNEDVARRLEALGFYRDGNRWLTKEQFAQRPPDPFADAVARGEVRPGMPRDLVKQVYGPPDQTVRTLSSGRLSEVWIYGESGKSRLSIYFQKGTRQPESDFRVIAIGNRAVRPKGDW